MIDPNYWRGRRVFLTGHTGFKGSWMALLLRSFGAHVYGYSLEPEYQYGLFNVAEVQKDVNHRIGDIRNLSNLRSAIDDAKPNILIHMAAQALVRPSYEAPVETFETNVMGTVNVLEAARSVAGLKAILVVTSDKCYENTGTKSGYRETDALGGHDPYSSSKGCTEIVTAAYRRSFYNSENTASVATARAGNVIGGGDWSRDRLVPDIIRAFVAGETLKIRHPNAIRPWQHVLDPIIGYLLLAQKLAQDGTRFDESWNFGPHEESEVPVAELTQALARRWGADAHWQLDGTNTPHEASYLKLDCSKSQSRLGWKPDVKFDQAIELTCDWYREFTKGADMRSVTLQQIHSIVEKSSNIGNEVCFATQPSATNIH